VNADGLLQSTHLQALAFSDLRLKGDVLVWNRFNFFYSIFKDLSPDPLSQTWLLAGGQESRVVAGLGEACLKLFCI